MEGGYVNEANRNIHTIDEKFNNPLLEKRLNQFSISYADSQAPQAHAHAVIMSSPSAIQQMPQTPSSSNSHTQANMGERLMTVVQGSMRNIRNFRNNKRVKNYRQRFHFEYISKDNFVGGQLKTKNGQKYVFNGPPSGVFISKTCATFTALIALLALISTILITYFITVSTLPEHSCLNGNSGNHGQIPLNGTPIATASMLGMHPPPHNLKYSPTFLPPTIGDIPAENDIFGENEQAFTDHKLQLYDGWVPLHYKIIIEPNIETSVNNGSIEIEVERDVKIATLEPIVLDVHNVSITDVRVIRAENNSQGEEVDIEFDSAYGEYNDTFIINISKELAEEKDLSLIISMEFVSHLTDTLQGIYKTRYTNYENNKQEWMVSTQFSPIDARRAFPCFDRPDMKANFTISIIHETKYATALSNMPVYHSSPQRYGYVRDDFLTSPKMPTYLLAFIVSNLVSGQYAALDNHLVPRIEIWTRPENVNMTNYAYSMVRKFLPFYEEYFGVKNRLQKIDIVSVPDFGFGAMENWGLVTFREAALLVPEDLEKASSSEHMEYVAQIIAHELAHQWFGNLVTPKWWDDLWLKEGFACYVSYIALNRVHPEYQIMDTFSVVEFKDSMEHDADDSAHAIAFDVKSTTDIQRMFDPITYSKGTILLRMLNSVVGNEAFRNAVKDLLNIYAYGNINRNDLWELITYYGHMAKTLPENMHVKDLMETWISQPGYPVVTVERQGAAIVLRQERYKLGNKNNTEKSSWVIPITFETDVLRKGHNIPSHWMTPADRFVVINEVFPSENNSENVVYINLNRNGYYRVNYDTDSWVALQKKFGSLPRVTRAQLMDDSLHLARAEYLGYDIPLTFLTELFTFKDDELLWHAAQNGLNYLVHMLQREPAYETFRAFMKFIVRPAYDRYGLVEPDDESHLQLQHRAVVAKLACKFNYDQCVNDAHKAYRNWMTNPKVNQIKPNLKPVIYCTAILEGSYPEWYFAYKQYKRTTSASEKEQILSSLGCTSKPWLLSKYLNMTINGTSGILKQDGARAFRSVAENPIGFEIAFDFLQTNIKEISEYFGDGFSTLTEMVKAITTYMNKDYHKDQLKLFAHKAHKLGLRSVERATELAMEQVNNNIYWRNRSYYNLKGFLETIVSDFRINIF